MLPRFLLHGLIFLAFARLAESHSLFDLLLVGASGLGTDVTDALGGTAYVDFVIRQRVQQQVLIDPASMNTTRG